jgi:hypothetical protein
VNINWFPHAFDEKPTWVNIKMFPHAFDEKLEHQSQKKKSPHRHIIAPHPLDMGGCGARGAGQPPNVACRSQKTPLLLPSGLFELEHNT